MEVQKTVYLFIIIGFMGACTHKANDYKFSTTDSVKIDESRVVLTRFPSQIEEINDSIVGTINSYQHLSLYNIYSGKNIVNFSIDNINFDSLIKTTFQKKYEGERIYNYNTKAMAGLSGMAEKIASFQYINNYFYIYVSTESEVEYLKDSTEILKLYQDERIKKLKKAGQKLNFHITDYVQFLFVTDGKFKLKEVIPLYDAPLLKKNNYSPLYERAFYVVKNELYFLLLKSDEAYEKMRSQKKLDSYYTAVVDLKDETKASLLLNNNNIDYSGFSFNNYLGNPTKFYNNNNELLFFNGKEICEVAGNKKIFSRKNLKADEWINDFYMNGDKIIMVNYNQDKKKSQTEFEEHYAIDSINSARAKVFDTKNSQWVIEKKLPSMFHFPFLVTKNKIIYLDKDKQNYYLKYIRYNEEN